MIISGDTIKEAQVCNTCTPENVPRIILIDTFKNKAEESIRVATALKKDLLAVRLGIPIKQRTG